MEPSSTWWSPTTVPDAPTVLLPVGGPVEIRILELPPALTGSWCAARRSRTTRLARSRSRIPGPRAASPATSTGRIAAPAAGPPCWSFMAAPKVSPAQCSRRLWERGCSKRESRSWCRTSTVQPATGSRGRRESTATGAGSTSPTFVRWRTGCALNPISIRERLGVFGGSYGGFACLTCVTRLPSTGAAPWTSSGPPTS